MITKSSILQQSHEVSGESSLGSKLEAMCDDYTLQLNLEECILPRVCVYHANWPLYLVFQHCNKTPHSSPAEINEL